MTYSMHNDDMDMSVLIHKLKKQFEDYAENGDLDDEDDEMSKKKLKPKQPSVGMCERIMDALCEDGRGDLLLLKDDEIREWWASVLRCREQKAKIRAEQERRERVRDEALRKLTDEERKVLGIKA